VLSLSFFFGACEFRLRDKLHLSRRVTLNFVVVDGLSSSLLWRDREPPNFNHLPESCLAQSRNKFAQSRRSLREVEGRN